MKSARCGPYVSYIHVRSDTLTSLAYTIQEYQACHSTPEKQTF